MSVVHEVETSFPKDIQYKVLVDPSEFIRSAVDNVFHEVFIAAALAVLVLFLFVGDLKNTATAAIEIPISMVMAFILMRMAGMNINLISLGGLALSAGMNVDASVVVMENILRYFEEKKDAFSLSWKEKVELVSKAVEEVFMPVVGSTIASLVVFIPLAFTSELTNAILGDLAKAVVFSHGLSAFVAIILVPTIRLQILSSRKTAIKEKHGPLEKPLRKLSKSFRIFFIFKKSSDNIFCFGNFTFRCCTFFHFANPTKRDYW
jgi:HAE1 family hydrophobic/amphiphilic exporter-1